MPLTSAVRRDDSPIKILEQTDSANLPQSTAGAIFTVTGIVEVIAIFGEVDTVIQAQANATKLQFNNGGTADLCATLDINAHASGSAYYVTGTAADPMVNVTTGILLKQDVPWILIDGDIELNCAASNTGTTLWVIIYRPLLSDSSVTLA